MEDLHNKRKKGGKMNHLKPLAVLLVLFVTGCIEYEEKIVLNGDGSGRITVHYYIDEMMTSMMDKMPGEKSDKEMPFIFEKEKIQSELASDDIKVDKIESYKDDEGKLHLVADLSFKDINKIPKKWVFENREFSFVKEGGSYSFRSALVQEKKPEEKGKEGSEELGDSFLAGYTFKFTVEMPGPVAQASAGSKIEKNTVTWEMPLSDISKKERIEMTASVSSAGSFPLIPVLIVIIVVIAVIIIVVLVTSRGKKKSPA
jgi:hypothetical protein